ncbi:MAG: LAGLIDADG family homing endonuclease [Candidatus Omnitrophica bacterium]|nr:LAGLIDADG family homing endonuclease [Candidatus Omnitrophota bacterium]
MVKNLADIDRRTLAYVIGVAIGDGNLSNPNGRAPRLRITCDARYPFLIRKFCDAIQVLLPENKVNIIKRTKSYVDISCYSKRWERWLGWQSKNGSKYQQNVSVPKWILENKKFSIPCLRGLIETDGSIYQDRGYKMVNFVTTIAQLANDVLTIMAKLGFQAHLYVFSGKHKVKYTVRLSRNVPTLIKILGLQKILSSKLEAGAIHGEDPAHGI